MPRLKSQATPLIDNLLSTIKVNEHCVHQILTLLSFCLSQNLCCFKGNIYQQPDGFAISNRLPTMSFVLNPNTLINKE